jgi:hypothetical protein
VFWVEFGAESRPKKESFGVGFTAHGKNIPKQEDMFGCHIFGLSASLPRHLGTLS